MSQITRIEVLDHGYVEYIDHMGSDQRVVNTARVSFNKQIDESQPLSKNDVGILKYLLRNNHTSPFENVVFQFRIKLPIFVMRQLVRHRTARLNEWSGRYAELKDECYVPKSTRMLYKSKFNKQGSEGALEQNTALKIIGAMVYEQAATFDNYQSYLEDGLSNEMARINLPLSTYTEIYWQMDLNNLFRFLKLRLDHHAQYEIRVFAEAIYEIIKQHVPICCEAFDEYILNAVTFSATEMTILRKGLEYLLRNADDVYPISEFDWLSSTELHALSGKLNVGIGQSDECGKYFTVNPDSNEVKNSG